MNSEGMAIAADAERSSAICIGRCRPPCSTSLARYPVSHVTPLVCHRQPANRIRMTPFRITGVRGSQQCAVQGPRRGSSESDLTSRSSPTVHRKANVPRTPSNSCDCISDGTSELHTKSLRTGALGRGCSQQRRKAVLVERLNSLLSALLSRCAAPIAMAVADSPTWDTGGINQFSDPRSRQPATHLY